MTKSKKPKIGSGYLFDILLDFEVHFYKDVYFTRNRKMPFEKLLQFLLSMYRTSSQNALNKFFENKGITVSTGFEQGS